jgi:hypothetical protein
VCPFGRVRRVFELAGVSEMFALYASREAALAALVPPDEKAAVRRDDPRTHTS